MTPDVLLSVWAIYERPRDFPEHFVVRRWRVLDGRRHPVPDHLAGLATSLEKARGMVPTGLTRLAHQPGEDPKIVETWV